MDLHNRQIYSGYLNKLMLLASVASPGVLRIAILFLISQLFSMEIVGIIVYKWAIVTIVSIMTVDGIGNLINSRLPNAQTQEQKIRIIGKQISNGLILLLICLIIWFILDYSLSYSDCLFAAAWMIYGHCRRVLLTMAEYYYLLVLDCLSIFTILSSIVYFQSLINSTNITLVFLPLAFFSLAVFFKLFGYSLLLSIRPSFEWVGVKFGIALLLSGGISLAILPVIKWVYGNEWVGYIGLVLSVLNIILLLPRAMAQYYMPKMAALPDREIYALYGQYKRRLYLSLCFIVLVSPVIWLLAKDIYFNVSDDPKFFYVFIVMYLSLVVGQLSLASSNYFSVKEITRPLLRSNYIYVLFMCVSGTIVYADFITDGFEGIMFLYTTVLISNVLRFIYIRVCVEKNKAVLNRGR